MLYFACAARVAPVLRMQAANADAAPSRFAARTLATELHHVQKEIMSRMSLSASFAILLVLVGTAAALAATLRVTSFGPSAPSLTVTAIVDDVLGAPYHGAGRLAISQTSPGRSFMWGPAEVSVRNGQLTKTFEVERFDAAIRVQAEFFPSTTVPPLDPSVGIWLDPQDGACASATFFASGSMPSGYQSGAIALRVAEPPYAGSVEVQTTAPGVEALLAIGNLSGQPEAFERFAVRHDITAGVPVSFYRWSSSQPTTAAAVTAAQMGSGLSVVPFGRSAVVTPDVPDSLELVFDGAVFPGIVEHALFEAADYTAYDSSIEAIPELAPAGAWAHTRDSILGSSSASDPDKVIFFDVAPGDYVVEFWSNAALMAATPDLVAQITVTGVVGQSIAVP